MDGSHATPIMKEITKMQVPQTDSAGQFLLLLLKMCNLDEDNNYYNYLLMNDMYVLSS